MMVEIKFDGERMMLHMKGNVIKLFTRYGDCLKWEHSSSSPLGDFCCVHAFVLLVILMWIIFSHQCWQSITRIHQSLWLRSRAGRTVATHHCRWVRVQVLICLCFVSLWAHLFPFLSFTVARSECLWIVSCLFLCLSVLLRFFQVHPGRRNSYVESRHAEIWSVWL